MAILVYGASGFTGRLVAAELRRLGLPVRLSGRDRARLQAVAKEIGGAEVAAAPVHDAGALAAAARGATVVVSCAGPFLRVGEPVVRAAIDAGAHYLDTTGEQAFLRDVLERFDSAARRAGVAVVPSCGFEIALGDYLAARAAARVPGRPASGGDPDPLDELVVAYAVEHFRPTPGTRASAACWTIGARVPSRSVAMSRGPRALATARTCSISSMFSMGRPRGLRGTA